MGISMKRAVISAGSNISPNANMSAAEKLLAEEQVLVKASRPRRTAPVPPAHGGWYLNRVFLIETALGMKELRDYLKDMERRLGRKRSADRYAPRTMDLDIIVFEGAIVNDDYYRYDFVRDAVDELVPGLKDQGTAGLKGSARETSAAKENDP